MTRENGCIMTGYRMKLSGGRSVGTHRDMSVVLSADARAAPGRRTALEALGDLGFEMVSAATTPEVKR